MAASICIFDLVLKTSPRYLTWNLWFNLNEFGTSTKKRKTKDTRRTEHTCQTLERIEVYVASAFYIIIITIFHGTENRCRAHEVRKKKEDDKVEGKNQEVESDKIWKCKINGINRILIVAARPIFESHHYPSTIEPNVNRRNCGWVFYVHCPFECQRKNAEQRSWCSSHIVNRSNGRREC